jgi:phytoene dehydrogenase-like protein
MYDTLIIGAGFSGLAAGVRLAHYGQKVAILERHYTIGGLNSFYRLHGRDFDVGLHAVTNYAPRGTRRGPLATILKRLQLSWDDFDLAPQTHSAIAFPGARLRFSNDFALLESEVARAFPKQIDGFRKLVASLVEYDDLKQSDFETWTRPRLAELITDPRLVEMLLCPLMWYGNGAERDMLWGAFCIMFRSCFLEGFSRPFDGIRPLLKVLVKKFRASGGELRLRAGIAEILHDGQRTAGVRLDDGEVIEARNVLSSAGWPETARMCGSLVEPVAVEPGRLSFIETHSVLDCQPKSLGIDDAIVFFNDHDQFVWERPEDDLCDVRTGVICSPNNYEYTHPDGSPRALEEGMIRLTALASHPRWTALEEDEYRRQKELWFGRVLDSAVRIVPDFRPHTVATDMFTPRTIERFTWHAGGTVYGSPQKRLDGRTPLENLYLCGTDQGFVGIIGSMIGGITMASHLLRGQM